MLTHINNRLAANKACPLPLETLMTIYKSDQGVSASTKVFVWGGGSVCFLPSGNR